MSITTITSREFNQDTSKAKKAAASGPVIITDRGRPAHVLLSIEAYRKLAGDVSIAEALAQNGDDADFKVDFPRMTGGFKPVDFD